MTLFLAGCGTALPTHAISQADAVAAALAVQVHSDEQRRLLPVLYRRAGVRSRHSVLLERDSGPPVERQSFYQVSADPANRGPTTGARMQVYDRAAPALAVAAARAALADAAVSPAEITHLITVSCSGFSAPGFDIGLLVELPLRPSTARTHIGFMGCQGALNALRVARAFTSADPEACVLVCALELCSLHHQLTNNAEQLVANALFADGAAAAVCRGAPRGRPAWEIVAHASTLLADSTDAMRWQIHDHGFQMQLSSAIPDLVRRELGPWLRPWLAEQGLTVEQIGSWAIHPGGPRILTAAGESLGLGDEYLLESQRVLAELGNMSSPTVLFIVDRLRQRQAPRPCVVLGFGPGVTFEAALIR